MNYRKQQTHPSVSVYVKKSRRTIGHGALNTCNQMEEDWLSHCIIAIRGGSRLVVITHESQAIQRICSEWPKFAASWMMTRADCSVIVIPHLKQWGNINTKMKSGAYLN